MPRPVSFFSQIVASDWSMLSNQWGLQMFWNKFEIGSKRSKKEAKNEAEFEDRNIDEPEDGGNISESEEENPINFTINQEPDDLLDDLSKTDAENYSDDDTILNVYGSFWARFSDIFSSKCHQKCHKISLCLLMINLLKGWNF